MVKGPPVKIVRTVYIHTCIHTHIHKYIGANNGEGAASQDSKDATEKKAPTNLQDLIPERFRPLVHGGVLVGALWTMITQVCVYVWYVCMYCTAILMIIEGHETAYNGV